MTRPPFFRPMLAGFAITAGAMLVLPMDAKAETREARACDAPAPKAHGLHLGKLLSAAQHSGMLQVLSGGALGSGQGGMLAGAVARTAIETAAQPQPETPANSVAALCVAPTQNP